MDNESMDSFMTANEEEEEDGEQANIGCTSTTMAIGQVVMLDSANEKSAVTTTNTTSSLTLLNLAAQQEAINQSIIKENNMLHKRLLDGAVSTTPKNIMGGISGAKYHHKEIINNRELVEQNKAYRKRLSQIQSPIKQYKIESEKKVEQQRKDLQEKRHRDSECKQIELRAHRLTFDRGIINSVINGGKDQKHLDTNVECKRMELEDHRIRERIRRDHEL